MLSPKINSIWKYKGPGPGGQDIQRVVGTNSIEVVTISERTHVENIDFSGLFETKEFPTLFDFVREEA